MVEENTKAAFQCTVKFHIAPALHLEVAIVRQPERLARQQPCGTPQQRASPRQGHQRDAGTLLAQRAFMLPILGIIDEGRQVHHIPGSQIPQDVERPDFVPLLGGYGIRWERNASSFIAMPRLPMA
jgi:hypothetical protein